MVDPAIALYANEAFYLAFNTRDIDAMDRLWSRHTPSVCIHPGWRGLFDRDEIMISWRDIFDYNQAETVIVCHEPRVLFQGNIMSVVCYEELPQGWLIATNNFVVENEEIHIFHHQASACVNAQEISDVGKPTIQ
jgi:hypothetical protein|tara:strand:+ start:368 stop:772 length:405 start_codon:yes stop_codon:yes gene_type:complete